MGAPPKVALTLPRAHHRVRDPAAACAPRCGGPTSTMRASRKGCSATIPRPSRPVGPPRSPAVGPSRSPRLALPSLLMRCRGNWRIWRVSTRMRLSASSAFVYSVAAKMASLGPANKIQFSRDEGESSALSSSSSKPVPAPPVNRFAQQSDADDMAALAYGQGGKKVKGPDGAAAKPSVPLPIPSGESHSTVIRNSPLM